MKEKGFTLIELLSVIVILAIIALIATPIILNIIKDAKEESNKRSVEMYAKAVENAVVQYQIKKHKMPTTYEDIKDYIKIDGEKISCEEIEIYEDGKIYIKGIKKDNDIVLAKSYGTKYYKNGDIVYYDVVNAEGCTEEDYHEDNSKTGYNGLEATKSTDNQNSCLKFYTFLDDGGKTINLLLDHNTTATVAWTTSETNENGPVDVKSKLKENTIGWNVPIISQNYEYKGTNSYPINYKTEEYRARLIEANEIAQITGASETLNWEEKESNDFYYFDGLKGKDEKWVTQVVGKDKEIKESEFYWLYDRTSSCMEFGCKIEDLSTGGYWTSSAYAKVPVLSWIVSSNGYISGSYIGNDGYCGVRPVIEILKSNL